MRRPGFDRGAKEIRNDDQQDLGQDKIKQTEFAAQSGGVSKDFGFSRFERRVVEDGQLSLSAIYKKSKSTLSRKRREQRAPTTLYRLFLLCRFQQQVLIVETEIGQRRDCRHPCAINSSVGVE